jgi:hypothetical protein
VAKPLNIRQPQKLSKRKNQAKGGSIQQQNQKFLIYCEVLGFLVELLCKRSSGLLVKEREVKTRNAAKNV